MANIVTTKLKQSGTFVRRVYALTIHNHAHRLNHLANNMLTISPHPRRVRKAGACLEHLSHNTIHQPLSMEGVINKLPYALDKIDKEEGKSLCERRPSLPAQTSVAV